LTLPLSFKKGTFMQINLPTVTPADMALAARYTKDVPGHLQNMVEHWAELVRQNHPGLSDDDIIAKLPTVAESEAKREAEHAAQAEAARLEQLTRQEQEAALKTERDKEAAAQEAKDKAARDEAVASQAQAMLQAALSQLPAHMQAELAKGVGAAPVAAGADTAAATAAPATAVAPPATAA
jgi:hypothetical protein